MLSKNLDEKMVKFNLEDLGVDLIELKNDQVKYIGIRIEGP